MILPGGLWQPDGLHREARFKPVDGHLEMALAEAAKAADPLPGRVSGVLGAALAGIGPRAPDRASMDGLSVGDRQFLMSRLVPHLGLEWVWCSATCRHCGNPFDFALDYGALPVKRAAEGYPFSDITLSSGPVTVRVPTGADQSAVLSWPDEDAARRALAARCVVGEAVALTEDDIACIETALEQLAPELATRVAALCPECGGDNALDIDPYYCLGWAGGDLFADIHQLAAYYHWSETQILDLPRWRRKTYLRLIDQARGLST